MASPQREAYQLPSQRDSGPSTQSTTTATTATAGATAATTTTAYTPSYGAPAEAAQISVTYICGECASKVALNLGDAIRCKECGHRVLYKERTKRMVQFDAR